MMRVVLNVNVETYLPVFPPTRTRKGLGSQGHWPLHGELENQTAMSNSSFLMYGALKIDRISRTWLRS